MASLFEETFEEGTNGAAITTANSGFNGFVTSGWTFSNAHVVPGFGSMAGRCAVTSGTCIANAGTAVWASRAVVYLTVPIYVETLPSSDTSLVSFRSGSSAVGELRLTSDGQLVIRGGDFKQAAASGVLATAGTSVRVQVKYDAGAGRMQLRVFSGANVLGSTPDYDSGPVAAGSLANTTNFQAGLLTSTTAAVHFADLAFDNAAFPGPSGNNPPTCTAVASPASNVAPGATITLTGTDSDSDGTIASRQWTQTSGPTVTLTGATTATATCVAPSQAGGATLGFRYTVTDNGGATAVADVPVTVLSSTGSVAYRASAQATNATTSTDTTVTIPAAVQPGDLMLVIFMDNGGVLTQSLTTAGWQPVTSKVDTNLVGVHVWWKTAVAGDAGSAVTVSTTNTANAKRTLDLLAYSGATLGAAAAKQAANVAVSHTAPAVIAVSANAWVINVFMDAGSPGSTSISVPSNLTVRQQWAHTGTAAITSTVADDDVVGSGSVGANVGTGTLSTSAAAEVTIILEPGTPGQPGPTANAGAAQDNVQPWATVTVGGTDTINSGTLASILWQQTDGADVTGSLSSTSAATVTFEAPPTVSGTTVVLDKTVVDSNGNSNTSAVAVTVLPVTRRAVVNGVEVPVRTRRAIVP